MNYLFIHRKYPIFAAVLSITQRPKIQKKAENNEFYNLKVNKAMNIKEFRTLTGRVFKI